MSKCDKKIVGYTTKVKEIANTIPYGSKYFGMAFIPEGEFWPTCGNCYREMVLALQILISDLPEPPPGLSFKDGDMLQIFTCGYIDLYTSNTWNEHTKNIKVKENHKCFNSCTDDINHNFLEGDVAQEYLRLGLEQGYIHECDLHHYIDRTGFGMPYSPLSFFTRVINVKNKKPIYYNDLPWLDAYYLGMADDETEVDRLKGMQISEEIKDKMPHHWLFSIYREYDGVVKRIPTRSLKIVGWEKFIFHCRKNELIHDMFSGCVNFRGYDNFEDMDYLGPLNIGHHALFEHHESAVYPSCQCCNQPMSLFFSFCTDWILFDHIFLDEGDLQGKPDTGDLQGLFYCQETGDMKVFCISPGNFE